MSSIGPFDEHPYAGRPPFVRDSETSEQAAESVDREAGTLRKRVWQFIQAQGSRGATDDEIELGLDMRHQTASARRRELVLKDKVRDSGQRRRTRSGRYATVWVTR